ncbi:MAG: sugar transferase, partial [Exiguobacterium marinum]|uniref:sugar transferase n=1 Tax=Exiguobacterium marinum TaxID=273528 RepID=UPI003C6184D5
MNMYNRFFKRPQDLLLAIVALVLLSPLIGGTALLIRLKLGGPVLFKQKRPGKDGVIFEMIKFRTMTDERDEAGELLSDDKRLTSFG